MPANKFDKLRNSRVLLLGGTSGIGFATAEASIEAGAIVIISGSNPDRLNGALSKLRASYPEASAANKIHGYTCDVSQASTLEGNLKGLLEFATDSNNNKIDHIVYTAGTVPHLPSLSEYETSETKTSELIVRHDTPLMLGKLAPAHMNPGPRSSITLTSASTAAKPVPGRGMLSALMASTEGIARGLAVDLAPIRVNVVAVGTIDTELLTSLMGPDPEVRAKYYEIFRKGTLLDTVGAAEDVAEAYVYLMKDAYITGDVIHTSGGRLLK
ncbi:uncharacterized protein N7459_004125 [Penicillium hispanicum]|uniref:uncharacterized protein n=1 Tax=Penicillium hispanicum TaxID=1080232 RepID=UPI00253F77AF|nr:uncharacterized protein N7459_004125 [Penicillium hispanicum]KAJ5584325.1 hypothetical protein N7459_004125 [Penicillium hispanicum]